MTVTIDPTTLDSEKLDAFMGLVVTDFAATTSTTLVYVGDKLGIYEALLEGGPQTPAELARRTSLNERLLQEWLNSQVAGAYVEHDSESGRYALEREKAFALADRSSPVYVGGLAEVLLAAAADADKVAEGIRTGKGVHWHEHDPALD